MFDNTKRNAVFYIAAMLAILLAGGIAIAVVGSQEPAAPVTSTSTSTSMHTFSETETKTKTKTKTSTETETPPERTVTETKAARSTERQPVSTSSETAAPSGTSTTQSNETASESPTADSPTADSVQSNGTWDRLAQCESGGDWSINTGNGFHGGLQFTNQSWNAFGGSQYAPTADQATKQQQIEVAGKLKATQGWGAWPSCSQQLGLN